MKDKIKVYEEMINLLIEMKDDKEAFNYSERARNRAFLDILGNQKIDFQSGVSKELSDREDDLIREIQIINSDLSSEEKKIPSERKKELINDLSKKLQKRKKDYGELLEEIKLNNPEYASCISVSPDKVENIQNLLDNETVFLEYFLGKEKSYLWVINKNNVKALSLNIKSDELNKEVKKYVEDNMKHMTVEKINSGKWKDGAGKFYNTLLKGGEKLFKDKKRLIIIPDGILNYLPFQILPDSTGKLVIDKYEIVYLPSGSVLKYCREKNKSSKNKLLAFGLGDFSIPGYSPLPYSKEEVNKISEFFNSHEIYMEKDMKLEKLYEKSGESSVMHFATHSILDTEAPLFSSLIFSDGQLEVYKAFGLNLSSNLVTLSACSTGLGEISGGDELIGLSRAFIYAGTPSVCVSLWDVADISTSELMEKFYYYLSCGKCKSEALRLAQTDIRKKYPHPFFWAPFILIGDWR